MSREMKILFIDIETAPKQAFVWGMYNQNIAPGQLIKDTYVLNWSAKWHGEDWIYWDALYRHKDLYKKDPTDDTGVLETMWELIDEADLIIAHNGDRFDLPTLNSRFVKQGMQPPSTYQTYDTLKAARRCFRMTFNKLDYLAQFLGTGKKIDTGGFELWRKIVAEQCLESFRKMVEYCNMDTEILEATYEVIAPWDNKHPSTVVLTDLNKICCNVCGSDKVYKNGSYATNTQRYQKYRCRSCGHSMRSRKAEKLDKNQKRNLLRSI